MNRIYASTAIPFVFPTPDGADGGIINPIPLDAVIQQAQAGDRILILSAHPLYPNRYSTRPDHQIGKVLRAFEQMQAALVRKSITGLLRTNRMLQSMGMDQWVDPADERSYKRFEVLVVAPPRPLPFGMLDFESAQVGYYMGRQLAQQALESQGWKAA